MRIFYTSSKDATIYSGSLESVKTGSNFYKGFNDIKQQNTGIDQILEVSAVHIDDLDLLSRALVQFDYGRLADLITGSILNPTFTLSLKTTKIREMPREFDIEVRKLNESWDMGLGKRQDNPITKDGVSWLWRDASGSNAWTVEGGTTQSVDDSFNLETVSFKQKTIDLEADITPLVNSHLTGSGDDANNNGFLIKFTDAAEGGSVNYRQINFFSQETHTIYRPKLIVDYNDHSLFTGSKTIINYDPFVAFTNLRKTYKAGNEYRLRLHVREQFPALTFSTGSPTSTANKNYLPNSSSYSVVDNVTEEIIVPFGNNSLISSDVTGSYMDLDFTGWEAERWYKILIKSDNGTSEVDIIDKDFIFKLVE